MPDFGNRWEVIDKEPVGGGGQARVYRVRDTQNDAVCAAKVLNAARCDPTSPRWKRIEEEITVAKSFDHPNVIRVLDAGYTPGSGYPFYVMPYYQTGPLTVETWRSVGPIGLLRRFAEVCDGVFHVHSRGVIHRDLKPANILIDETGRPVVGDFGLSFRLDAESLTETQEVAAARWFGAPELRNGHCEHPSESADVYSLGKVLYWLFTGRVFDREEQDYGTEDRRLAVVVTKSGAIASVSGVVDYQLIHAAAIADDIVGDAVRYKPQSRVKTAGELARRARVAAGLLEAGGRALDLRLPLRCLFCGIGEYKPLVTLPPREKRPARVDPTRIAREDIYGEMRDAAQHKFAVPSGGQGALGPLILMCPQCGNAQLFRFDLVPDSVVNWKP